MDYLIKKASALSSEEKANLGLTGIPEDWPIEKLPYTGGNVPDGYEVMSDSDLADLIFNNQAAYDAWLQAKRPLPPQPAPQLVSLDIPKDTGDIPYFKQMVAEGDKKFRAHCMVFTTGKYKSVFCKDSEGTDLNIADLVFLDANRNVLTKGESESDPDFQTRLDQNCKFTWLYFTPNVEYGISKGRFMFRGTPSGDFHNWLEFAPHIPKAYGGSVPCLEGAFPLDMLDAGQFYQMDGCACLIIKKDETYYSHRIGHKIEHEIGDKLKICSIFDIYV